MQQLIEWLDEHDGEMPKGTIRIGSKTVKKENLTAAQLKEVELYRRWINSPDRAMLEGCAGTPIEDLPKQYRRHAEEIQRLREFGLGLPKKTMYEELTEWLKTHDGNMPRSSISRNGVTLLRNQLNKAQTYEINLYYKWLRSPEREALEACKRNTARRITTRIPTI